MIKCNDCGHVGDVFESTYQINGLFKFILQCSQCGSQNVRRE
jgi:hypothetical protein